MALGYWILSNICRYWVMGSIVIGWLISLWYPIRYRSDSRQHSPHNNHLDICGAAVVSRGQQGEWAGGRVQAIHCHHIVLRLYVLYIFRLKINTLLCYTVVSVLVLGIGIGRGQYYWYWILGALFGIVLTLITRQLRQAMHDEWHTRCVVR